MEKRKESLRAAKVCRFCLSQDQSLDSLYDRNRAPKNAINIHLKILSCVSMEVFPSDKMPGYICHRCKAFMSLFYDFKQIVRTADESILQYLQNGTPMETIVWPASLAKLIPNPNEINVKTVVEGGATIQVSSQDISDSDEEDGNIYNIKIGDGLDDSNTACIKVVTSKEDEKEDSVQTSKGFVSLSKLTKHVRSHAGDRPYPCKFCDKSFLKSHHYTRHLRVKHRSRHSDQYRCEQCDDTFATQDDLIYHSAIHATQNLTCPLCQEKFDNVDDVTTHIKSHVNGVEFECDFCELVFTTKEKLDNHLIAAHEDELQHEEIEELEELEESSIEELEDDNGINLKDEGDHMVIEINKDDYMINKSSEADIKPVNLQSEDSESENTYSELEPVVDTLAANKKSEAVKIVADKPDAKIVEPKPVIKKIEKTEPPAVILQKPEDIKRKADKPPQEAVPEKKEKKSEPNSGGASDKSLRLLEKELQDLKRTNTKPEGQKASPKNVEMLRNKRPQLQTSTPKSYGSRVSEEKKFTLVNKIPSLEKKPERKQITKENKEPKEVKESKTNNGKEEKETPKIVVKNGSNNDKNTPEDSIRRSTRPSKIKDYAKMVQDKSQASDVEESSDEDEEYRESDKSIENRSKVRRVMPIKAKPADSSPTIATGPRKRGRPRKESKNQKEVPTKVRKDDDETVEEEKVEDTSPKLKNIVKDEKKTTDSEENETTQSAPKTPPDQKPAPSDLLVSPSGQTLKKVPVRALPPGIKPLPLPVNARPVASGELCEMQIGKKVVKVQKIVMTKAEVEAMAKKGLVEMKDGTMVLKQGIKLPAMESSSAKTFVGEGDASKESLIKKEKSVPTRCDLGDDT